MKRIAPLLLLAAACGGPPPARCIEPPVSRHLAEPTAPRDACAVPCSPPPQAISAMLAEVDPARVRAIVEKLASFGTRHTLSDADSKTRGIGAAREWIREEIARTTAGTPMRVELEAHHVEPDGKRVTRPVELVNVVATLPGASPRAYYVVGHYDSRATDANDATSDAPGANDDASGVAVVMELARVMSERHFDATVVFLATAGEEQGLLGAKLHVDRAKEEHRPISGVLNDDIVGDPSSHGAHPFDRAIRVFSEGVPGRASPEELAEIRKNAGENDSASRELARYVAMVAAWEKTHVQPMLVFRPDRYLRGGDHLPFLEAGFPAVRFTTVDEHYDRQHQNVTARNGAPYGDVPAFVDGAYLANVARVDLAALAHLANAPAAPKRARIVTAELGNDVLLRWDRGDEPDLAGHEVVWRKTTDPEWTHAKDAGNGGEARLAVSKDDHLFGVRAYDKDGYRSPAAFARASKE